MVGVSILFFSECYLAILRYLFVMYASSTWKGILKKFLTHIAVCPFVPYFPNVNNIQCWKILVISVSPPPGISLKSQSRYRNSLQMSKEILGDTEKCKDTSAGKENQTFFLHSYNTESWVNATENLCIQNIKREGGEGGGDGIWT